MSDGETVRQHDLRVYGVDPYTVACPLCEAPVGQLCATPAGKSYGEPHVTRMTAARAELESKAQP